MIENSDLCPLDEAIIALRHGNAGGEVEGSGLIVRNANTGDPQYGSCVRVPIVEIGGGFYVSNRAVIRAISDTNAGPDLVPLETAQYALSVGKDLQVTHEVRSDRLRLQSYDRWCQQNKQTEVAIVVSDGKQMVSQRELDAALKRIDAFA